MNDNLNSTNNTIKSNNNNNKRQRATRNGVDDTNSSRRKTKMCCFKCLFIASVYQIGLIHNQFVIVLSTSAFVFTIRFQKADFREPLVKISGCCIRSSCFECTSRLMHDLVLSKISFRCDMKSNLMYFAAEYPSADAMLDE